MEICIEQHKVVQKLQNFCFNLNTDFVVRGILFGSAQELRSLQLEAKLTSDSMQVLKSSGYSGPTMLVISRTRQQSTESLGLHLLVLVELCGARVEPGLDIYKACALAPELSSQPGST